MDTFYTILAIIFIVAIFCCIFSFQSLYSWNNFKCKPGFYETYPNDDVLVCMGKLNEDKITKHIDLIVRKMCKFKTLLGTILNVDHDFTASLIPMVLLCARVS